MGVNDKSAQSDFLISVAGISELWATLSGGVPSSDSTNSWDGGSLNPDIQMGPVTYSDVTVSRPYKMSRDAPLAARLRPKVNNWVTSATKQPTDKLKVKGSADPTKFSLVLKSVAEPDVDASSAATAMLTLTFACNGVT